MNVLPKISLLAFFSFAPIFFVNAQSGKDNFSGWYVDTLHANVCYFAMNGKYEAFFADGKAECHQIGEWEKSGDTILLHINWYYSDLFNPMCDLGWDGKDFVPFNDTMIADSGNVYNFRDYKDSVYSWMMKPWDPSSNAGLSACAIQRLKSLHHDFDESFFHPVQMNKNDCTGYYCWHGDRGYQSLRLKKSGKFTLRSYSTAYLDQNWKDVGKWRVSGDTLILQVMNGKTFGFERAYRPWCHHFYFSENCWEPHTTDPDCAFSKQLYRFSRKKFRKYSK